jgi:hypothetical protein
MSGEPAALPEFYPQAFEQLRQFQIESKCPRTGSFQWCASPATVADVTEFLTSAHQHSLVEPTLSMGIDGAVMVIWHQKEWWINADFNNAAYLYAITRTPDATHKGLLKAGHSKTNGICDVLVEYVKQVYQEQAQELTAS